MKNGILIKGGHRDAKLITKRYVKRSGSIVGTLATGALQYQLGKNYLKKMGLDYAINTTVDYLPTLGNTSAGQVFKSWSSYCDQDRPYIKALKNTSGKYLVPYISEDPLGRRYRKSLKRKLINNLNTVF